MSLSPCKTVSLHTFAEELIGSMISSYHQCSPILTDFFFTESFHNLENCNNSKMFFKFALMPSLLEGCYFCISLLTCFHQWAGCLSRRSFSQGHPLPPQHTHTPFVPSREQKEPHQTFTLYQLLTQLLFSFC